MFANQAGEVRVVRGPAGGEHGGVRVPDDDAAGLARHRQGPLVEQDRGRHRPLLLLLGVRAHSGTYSHLRHIYIMYIYPTNLILYKVSK